MPEVIAEVVYVLNGVYKVTRSEIRDTLVEVSFDKKLNKNLI